MLSTSTSSFSRFLRILSKACLIPHPAKASFGGEDYYFISKNKTTIGVADGVGGWADVPGASSTKYSHDLMNFCNESSNITNPLMILETAYDQLDFSVQGSTTALVAQICDDTKLHICNVGDSALGIFRNGKLIFQTKDTLHGFNFPFQLGSSKRDKPSDGTYDIIPIQTNDLIITGTDGLWDNVWTLDIEKHINDLLKNNGGKLQLMEKLANVLAKEANHNGQDKEFNSPFANDALKYGYRYIGGKLDDVTVIASFVVDNNEMNE